MDFEKLQKLARLIRYYILISSTEAGSGHPTSSFSATEIMTTLMFGGFFKAELDNPHNPDNDRLIFSKGHASPLFYALYAAAGKVSEEELKTLRKFGSKLEGHPTMQFEYTEAATGSLGQGLSVGVGMALNAKLDKSDYRTYVLLGDSEMAEGSIWEAMEIASHYNLDNLIGIIDVNRLGQRGETMLGHDVETYKNRAESFGWQVFSGDGHNPEEVYGLFKLALEDKNGKPKMLVFKTLKGKGVSFLEDKDGWHGKALSREDCEKALVELGEVDKKLIGEIPKPNPLLTFPGATSTLSHPQERIKGMLTRQSQVTGFDPLERGRNKSQSPSTFQGEGRDGVVFSEYKLGDMVATRKAYGNIIAKLVEQNPDIVVLDAEVSNSTYAETVKKNHPERFFEMYIAEQNMVGAALGFSRRGKIPFVSTFAAFFSRAFDQIRMSQYSEPNIKFVGSHVGVSIGEDGSSQMGLEDIAMFRTNYKGVVLYPGDAVSAEKLIAEAAGFEGNVYIRTTRAETPVIYKPDEDFPIGGSKIIKMSEHDVLTIVAAGITLHEAIQAQKVLLMAEIQVRVIDLYSIKPIDTRTLQNAAHETHNLLVVEDHYEEGGIGEAVRSAVSETGARVYSLAVTQMPKSGKPNELLAYEKIDSGAIIEKVKEILKIK